MTLINMYSSDNPDKYVSKCGMVLQREWGTLTPNGNDVAGRWVLRTVAGTMIDFCTYRNDLADMNNLNLVDKNS